MFLHIQDSLKNGYTSTVFYLHMCVCLCVKHCVLHESFKNNTGPVVIVSVCLSLSLSLSHTHTHTHTHTQLMHHTDSQPFPSLIQLI